MFRLTPRQVVVIVPRSPADPRLAELAGNLGPVRLDELLLATLRDAIAAAVRVDGATIAVVASTPGQVADLRQLLPAGVEFAAPPEPMSGGRLNRFALVAHQGREFERIVILDGAVLRLTSRVVGTGLGALAGADVVIGSTRHGATYAFGLLERHAGRFARSDEPLLDGDHPAANLIGRLQALRLGTRRLDPLPTLDAFGSLDDLRAGMLATPGAGRHLTAFLTSQPITVPLMVDRDRHV